MFVIADTGLCIDLLDLSLVALDTFKHSLTLAQELFCLLFIGKHTATSFRFVLSLFCLCLPWHSHNPIIARNRAVCPAAIAHELSGESDRQPV